MKLPHTLFDGLRLSLDMEERLSNERIPPLESVRWD
jgi:hypothetical protein